MNYDLNKKWGALSVGLRIIPMIYSYIIARTENRTQYFSNRSIWPIDGTLIGYGIERTKKQWLWKGLVFWGGIRYIYQSSRTGNTPRSGLVSCPGHPFFWGGGSKPPFKWIESAYCKHRWQGDIFFIIAILKLRGEPVS